MLDGGRHSPPPRRQVLAIPGIHAGVLVPAPAQAGGGGPARRRAPECVREKSSATGGRCFATPWASLANLGWRTPLAGSGPRRPVSKACQACVAPVRWSSWELSGSGRRREASGCLGSRPHFGRRRPPMSPLPSSRGCHWSPRRDVALQFLDPDFQPHTSDLRSGLPGSQAQLFPSLPILGGHLQMCSRVRRMSWNRRVSRLAPGHPSNSSPLPRSWCSGASPL